MVCHPFSRLGARPGACGVGSAAAGGSASAHHVGVGVGVCVCEGVGVGFPLPPPPPQEVSKSAAIAAKAAEPKRWVMLRLLSERRNSPCGAAERGLEFAG